MDFKKDEWNDSYKNRDNFVFYPNEEIIRFVSKYLKKKISFDQYDVKKDANTCLDLGCGIGRHVIYLDDLHYDVYGIDLSDEAIDFAKKWFGHANKSHLIEKLTIGSITNMPYETGFFDFVISHGVLDSMHYNVAQDAVKETARVLKKNGFFYIDLISGDDGNHEKSFSGEEVVNTDLEKNTIQSYFNINKIQDMLGTSFIIEDIVLVERGSVSSNQKDARYHVVCKRK